MTTSINDVKIHRKSKLKIGTIFNLIRRCNDDLD